MIKIALLWVAMALGALVIIAAYSNGFLTDSTKNNLKDFGLIGTWSGDCAGKPRTTFVAPFIGSPTGVTTNDGSNVTTTVAEIKSAALVTQDKLKMITHILKVPDADKSNSVARQAGETWHTVYERVGKKLRVMEIEREDGKKVIVRSGYLYQSKDGAEPVKTMNFMLLIEKCL